MLQFGKWGPSEDKDPGQQRGAKFEDAGGGYLIRPMGWAHAENASTISPLATPDGYKGAIGYQFSPGTWTPSSPVPGTESDGDL